MGDFNVSCFVSRLTIDNHDEIYAIPLTYNKDFNPKMEWMYYPTDMYEPATLPILGTYENYGRIEPEINDHTKFLEKKYRKSIRQLVNLENGVFDAFVYVHKEIYDAIAKTYVESYSGKKKDMYNYEEEFDRFSYQLNNALKSALDDKKFFRSHMNDKFDTDEHCKKHVDYAMNSIKKMDFYISGDSNVFNFGTRRMEDCMKMYKVSIMKKRFRKEIIDFVKFNHHLYSVCTPYIPVPMGEQYGNHYMSKVLLKASTTINNNKIKRQKEWEKE